MLPYSNVTYAIIDTIYQNSKEPVPGLVWQRRKKPLLDEFKMGEALARHFDKENVRIKRFNEANE